MGQNAAVTRLRAIATGVRAATTRLYLTLHGPAARPPTVKLLPWCVDAVRWSGTEWSHLAVGGRRSVTCVDGMPLIDGPTNMRPKYSTGMPDPFLRTSRPHKAWNAACAGELTYVGVVGKLRFRLAKCGGARLLLIWLGGKACHLVTDE